LSEAIIRTCSEIKFEVKSTPVPVIKICGKLEKKKTQYDGVRPVLSVKAKMVAPDQPKYHGKTVTLEYFAVGLTNSTKKYLSRMPANNATKRCLVGYKSLTQKIDSPADFLVFEIVH